MRHLSAFISVDTSLMHLAAAVRPPNQIVIEAPTLNATNMPFRGDYSVVRNPAVNGKNLEYYRYDGREIQGTREHLIECMNSIGAEDVYAVLKERLG
jgi:ADP-heptose:LPS heptosyltransferase